MQNKGLRVQRNNCSFDEHDSIYFILLSPSYRKYEPLAIV